MLTIVTLSDVPAAVRKKTVGTAGEWRAAGITPAQFRSLTRAGDLVRVRHSVYATRSAVESAISDPRQAHALRVAAARAAVGRQAVASHQSAAVLHGIDLLRDPSGDAVWLTRPPGQYSGLRLEGIHLHSARLPEQHVMTLYGVRATTVTRTVLDLARSMPFMEGVVAADSALRLGKTDPVVRGRRKHLSAVQVEVCRGAPTQRKWNPRPERPARAVHEAQLRAAGVGRDAARIGLIRAGHVDPQRFAGGEADHSIAARRGLRACGQQTRHESEQRDLLHLDPSRSKNARSVPKSQEPTICF